MLGFSVVIRVINYVTNDEMKVVNLSNIVSVCVCVCVCMCVLVCGGGIYTSVCEYVYEHVCFHLLCSILLVEPSLTAKQNKQIHKQAGSGTLSRVWLQPVAHPTATSLTPGQWQSVV